MPRKPDVADRAIPPEVTEGILETYLKLGVTRVWLQSGAESEKTVKFCEDHGIEVVHGVCVMVQRRKSAA